MSVEFLHTQVFRFNNRRAGIKNLVFDREDGANVERGIQIRNDCGYIIGRAHSVQANATLFHRVAS